MGTPVQPGLDAAIGSPIQDNGAQSPAPSPAAFAHGATGERTFSEADIQAARKQEKDKLYGEISSLKDQFASSQKLLQDLQSQRQEELDRIERERLDKESLKKAKKEEEMSAKALLEAKLKETNETWEARFQQLQSERENERALIAKERAYNELVDYKTSQLNANANEIAPQFHNFITGETKEQIDNAIAQAKIATQSIADEVAAARQQQMSQMRGVSATGYTALGPMDGAIGQKQYSPQDIANMSMSEYAKFRQESGMAARTTANDRGILG